MAELIAYQNEEYALALRLDIARELQEAAASQKNTIESEEESDDELDRVPMSPNSLRKKRLAYFAASQQCIHTTKKGARCKNASVDGNACRVHRKKR